MTVDIRAEVTCSLGTIIRGSFADDYLQGNGLIKTRGEVVLSGTKTPEVGTTVTFTYAKASSTYTIPRVLRVLSSFADPFRDTTTVQLGCKLTYLENRKPPIEDPNAKEEHSDVPCKVFLKATLPISAKFVFQKCIGALGLSSASVPLTNKFSVEEFDLTPGYVQVMSDLLQSEGYVGYLDSSETLQILNLAEETGTGPSITPADVVDLGPIGVGELPGKSVVVRYSSLRLLPPDDQYGDEYLKRSWELEEVFGPETEVTVSYQDDEGNTVSDSDVFYPYTLTATRYDKWDRKIESINLSITSSAEINNRWSSDAFKMGMIWNQPTARITHEEIEYVIAGEPVNTIDLLDIRYIGSSIAAVKSALYAGAENDTNSAEECKDTPPDGYEAVKAQTTSTYFSELELAGSLNIDTYIQEVPGYGGTLVIFDLRAMELESQVTVEYETDAISGISKTITKRYISRSQTVSGQQDLATQALKIDLSNLESSINELLAKALPLAYVGVDTQLHTQREYGLQKRPSEAERNNTANQKPNTEEKAEIAWVTGGATSAAVTEFSLPYAPDDEISWNAYTGQFSSKPSDAKEKALRYGRIQNKLLLGNRSGLSLQIAPDKLPKRPFDPLYLKAGGLTASYRANGTSWAFDAKGIVGSTDALLWGAVSAAPGTDLTSSWVPLPPGITSLPEPYTPTTGGLDSETGVTFSAVIDPITVLPPYVESVLLQGITRTRLSVTVYPYNLDRGTETAVLRTRAGVVVGNRLAAGLGSLLTTGQNATLRYTKAIKASAGSVALSGYGAGSIRDYRIGTNYGVFTAAGQNAIVAYQRAPLAAEAGSFALSGQDSSYRKGGIVAASAGGFTLSGPDAGSIRHYKLSADTASFAFSGQDAGLTYTAPVFSYVTYTGNATARSITGVGFAPSIIWINNKSSSIATGPYLFDQLQGSGRYWWMGDYRSPTISATTLTSFDSDGFSLGTSGTTNSGSTLYKNYEAYCWKASTTTVTNTTGTITTQVRASDAIGISYFTYTGNGTAGATLGHGLSGTPDFVIIKRLETGLTSGCQQPVASPHVGSNRLWWLGYSSAATSSSTDQIRTVGSSTISIGTSVTLNSSTRPYICYAFKSVAGISRINVVTGDGSGTLSVNLGFMPSFILTRVHNGTSDWNIYRPTGGATGYATYVQVDDSIDPTVSTTVQITSTGFSIDAGGQGNVSGSTSSLFYMAYA